MKVSELLALAGPDAEILIMEEYDNRDNLTTWRAAPVEDRIGPFMKDGRVVLAGNTNGPFLVSGNAGGITQTSS